MENRKPNILHQVDIQTIFTILFVGAIILFFKPQTSAQEFFYGVVVGLAIVLFATIVATGGKASQ